jgi:hypothetical protein
MHLSDNGFCLPVHLSNHGSMTDSIHAEARIFRTRTEFVPLRRELRLYVLCDCGRGGWLVSVPFFPELFLNERLIVGLTVREALAAVMERYPRARRLAELLDPLPEPSPALTPAASREPRPRRPVRQVQQAHRQPRKQARLLGQAELRFA